MHLYDRTFRWSGTDGLNIGKCYCFLFCLFLSLAFITLVKNIARVNMKSTSNFFFY